MAIQERLDRGQKSLRNNGLVLDQKFRGGMNLQLPYFGLKRVNATTPFASLRISDSELSLGGAPWSGLPSGLRSVEYPKSCVRQAFRCRHGVLLNGIGFDTTDDKTHYFWTFRSQRVLDSLAAHGYPIGPDRRPGLLEVQGLPWPRRSEGQPPPGD